MRESVCTKTFSENCNILLYSKMSLGKRTFLCLLKVHNSMQKTQIDKIKSYI